MAFFNKIGLLILNEDQTKFLVCEKAPNDVTADYIMPGGQFNERSEEECLKVEIKEELNCDIDLDSLKFIAEYIGPAAGMLDKDVSIRLWQGKIIGEPKPSTEIKFIHWIGKDDMSNLRVSPIVRDRIILDLIKRNILK
jgi:hypothetical protein